MKPSSTIALTIFAVLLVSLTAWGFHDAAKTRDKYHLIKSEQIQCMKAKTFALQERTEAIQKNQELITEKVKSINDSACIAYDMAGIDILSIEITNGLRDLKPTEVVGIVGLRTHINGLKESKDRVPEFFKFKLKDKENNSDIELILLCDQSRSCWKDSYTNTEKELRAKGIGIRGASMLTACVNSIMSEEKK